MVEANAIELDPSPSQIAAALARGKNAAQRRVPPDQLYTWFGATEDLKPKGFLLTKLDGVTVMATHFYLRGEEPSAEEVAQIVGEKTLLVNVILFGERPDFAMDSYMVLEQGSRAVKPVNVRFDGRAARSSIWPNSPKFRAKVVASFAYADLDSHATSKLSVFPRSGGEVSFTLELSQIK